MPIKKKAKVPAGQFTVQWMALDKIKRYANNPRSNDEAVQAVLRSLNEFGWRQPLVVDKQLVIIVGDTRYLAAKKRGDTMVPVHIAADLSPNHARAYRIADNKVGEISDWNSIKLLAEIDQLMAVNFDLTSLGFDEGEIAEFTKAEGDNRLLEDFDLTPAPRPVWVMISSNQQEASKIISVLEKMGLKHTRIETTMKS